LGLIDDDLQPLELFLLDNPNSGNIMEGTGGIRILYVDFIISEKICMFDLFPKDQKDNLTQSEKKALKQIVKTIGEEFRK
jgi:hypothetical protein